MRVLIVKLSSLGDVVHTLPVVRDIRAAHPAASVDWVVEPAFAPLVRRVEGIGEVIDCPMRRWRERWWKASTRAEWRSFKARLQRESYDAIIDLQGLIKSAFIARTARGRRYAMANATEGSSYEAATRWVADVAIELPEHIHAVDRARQLVGQALGAPVTDAPVYGLRRSPSTLRQRTVVFVHGSSREDKLWPESRWVGLGRRFVEAGWHIALPHGDELEQLRAERVAAAIDSEATAFVTGVHDQGPIVNVWPRLKLDALIDRLAATHGVIGVDSGVSHIAVALGLPHVQLYLHPTAWRTGPQAAHGQRQQLSLGDKAVPTVDETWAAWQSIMRRAADPKQ